MRIFSVASGCDRPEGWDRTLRDGFVGEAVLSESATTARDCVMFVDWEWLLWTLAIASSARMKPERIRNHGDTQRNALGFTVLPHISAFGSSLCAAGIGVVVRRC